jgi:hypothetical protein
MRNTKDNTTTRREAYGTRYKKINTATKEEERNKLI